MSLPGVRSVSVARSPLGLARANAVAPPRLPLQVRLYLDARMRVAVRRELEGGVDLMHVTLARLGPYVVPGVRTHLDFVDALSVNMRGRADASRGPERALFAAEARLMRRYEASLATAVHSSSLVSESDRAAAPWLASAAVIPNGVDREAFPFSDPAERPPRLVFFGNLGYFHNVEPARYLATEVLPRVRREVPDATLELAGARPAAAVRRVAGADGVSLAADVPRMVDELHGAAVAVLPMFSGSGMKNKVLEAFCAGTPVVTNAAGIDGVAGARPGVHHVQAEGADALAAECVRLLREPGRRSALAREAVALVEHEYGWARSAAALLELYGL
jgi:glycosyltransferase involved in cell wall biosynthesis